MMRPWLLSELEAPLNASLKGSDASVSGVSIDSRSMAEGALFVALRGENFDGHDYIEQAAESGAVAALVNSGVAANPPLLEVKDTQRALGMLGAYNRSFFIGTLVAITGSGGKTTVKNLIASVLCRSGETISTRGNFNNEIGVPLTLLEISPQHKFAVVEMGAARSGDIKWLVGLGRPSVAVLLNAMPAHLESFGSVEDVARAKGEILEGLDTGDVAVFNADQVWEKQWRKRVRGARILDFGIENSAATVRAAKIVSQGFHGISFSALTPIGDFPVSLQLPGKHNVANALAAIAVGIACDVPLADIQSGLSAVQPVSGRLALVETLSGVTLIDDCYNAQPASVKAAIDVLAQCEGRRTLVLGAMKELGSDSEALHVDVAQYAKAVGIDQLWGVGAELEAAIEAFGQGGRFFQNRDQAIKLINGVFNNSDTVLVKGSRSAGMELVLAHIATCNSAEGV